MIRTSVCAAPWDILGDPGAAERFAAFGADSVSLAAAYHAVRAATPRHLTHRFVEATHSALYLPLRDEAWRGQRLRPSSAAGWTGDENAFVTARNALRTAGVKTVGWVVLTHEDPAGAAPRNDELRVRTAFGEHLSHALCPSSEDVVAYCATLVSETARSGVKELMLEAVGQLGFEHGSAHDKTTGSDWSAADLALMSICFCGMCSRLMTDIGLEVSAVARVVRASVGSGVMNVEEALGEFAEPILALRRRTARNLLEVVVAEAHAAGVTRVTAHAGLDPWATSSFSPLGSGPVPVDALVLSDGTVSAATANDIATIRRENEASVAAYISALPPHAPDELAEHWTALAERGVDEFVVYHGGLVSAARASAVAGALVHVNRFKASSAQ